MSKIKRHGDHKVMSADVGEGKKVSVVFVDHTGAEERIMRAMYRIRSNVGLLGIATMSDRMVAYIPAMIPTCATDGRNLYYNPLFVEQLTGAQIRFVMLHEVMHVAYSHHLRLGERDMRIANIAMDYVVNGILMNTDAHAKGFIQAPAMALHDDFFVGKDWSFETVYEYLIAHADKYPMVKQILDGGDQGDTCPKCGGQIGPPQDGDEDGDGDEQQAGGQDGDEDGDGDEQQQGHGHGGRQPCQCEGNEHGMDGRRPDGMRGYGTWGEVWPAPAEVLEKAKQEHQEIQEKLAEADFMEKSFSPSGGSDAIAGKIRDSEEDTVGWYYLKDFLTEAYSYERTWARPNLLRIGQAYYPSRDKQAGTLHCVFDTSGSVSQRELEIYFANVQAICEQVGVHTLKLAYVDAEIRRPTGETWQTIEVGAGEEIEMMVTGRGGTQFDPIFHAIEEEQEDVHCLIYFTDGWGHCTVRPPNFHVVWATSQDPVQWWGTYGSWGEEINVNPSQI